MKRMMNGTVFTGCDQINSNWTWNGWTAERSKVDGRLRVVCEHSDGRRFEFEASNEVAWIAPHLYERA